MKIEQQLAIWLRRKKPGAIVSLREFVAPLLSMLGVWTAYSQLSVRVFRKNGDVEDLGIVGTHCVTDVFVAALVDELQSSAADFSTYKYHDSGTDDTAENQTNTGLGAACGDARTTGTQTEGATANIYKSVATHTYGGTYAIDEHGLFNASTVGDLMDRTVLASTVNVESGDKIEFTYQLTCTAGG